VTLGTVRRLQIQRGRLKLGPRGARTYDPAPLLSVDELHVTAQGSLGRTAGEAGGAWLLDVHHAAHPETRHRADSPVSVLTTGGYAALRGRWGEHLADGLAGESVLLDGDVTLDDLVAAGLPAGATLRIGAVVFSGLTVAAPCVEFTRFTLGRAATEPVDAATKETLAALDGGVRGLYAVPVAPGVVRVGDPAVLQP